MFIHIKSDYDDLDTIILTGYARRLKLMTWRHNLELEKIVTELSNRVSKPGKLFCAIDSTVDTVFGQQIQGAEPGYNPHKPGRNSYHPLLAVNVDARSVIDGYLRPGTCSGSSEWHIPTGTQEFIANEEYFLHAPLNFYYTC